MTEQLPITDVETAAQAETAEHEVVTNETQAATEGGHTGGVAETLGINAGLFVSQFINFVLVFLVIWFLILKPLTKKLEERRKIIDESLDRAKEIESRMVMADAAYEEKIKEARANADSVIAKAHEESKMLSEKMKQDTKNEIATLVSQAKEKIKGFNDE
jgi:F-type H+-transporting ATPase subunit b